MRIEIEKNIDAETREIWVFTSFNLDAVFVEWRKEVKPKGKRKWYVSLVWDKYARNHNCSAHEPALPDEIREAALVEFTKLVKVKTWNEWKS